jgi:hypothetical protein
MGFIYKVDSSKAVKIWTDYVDSSVDAPILLQPTWPNGTEWQSKAEASAWAEAFITALVDPESELLAGDGPEEPTKPRVVALEEVPIEETPSE